MLGRDEFGGSETYLTATARFPDYCLANHCNLHYHNTSMSSVVSCLSVVCVLLKTFAVSLRDSVCSYMGSVGLSHKKWTHAP